MADSITQTSPEHSHQAATRPLGGTEQSWLRAVPGGTGVTVLALLLSRPVQTASLLYSLHSLLSSHPVLRSHLHLQPQPLPPLLSTPPLSLSSPHIETIVPTSLPDSPLHSILELELNRNPWADEAGPDAEPVPLFFATVYELPEPAAGSHVLALRFHTGFCDRASAVHVLEDLTGWMTSGSGEGEERPCGKGEVIPGIEELLPKRDAWKPFWARGRDLVGYSINGLRSALLSFEDADSARSSEAFRLVMSREETQMLLSACEKRGIKLFGALSAAGMKATVLSKNLEDNQAETYPVVTLIDCRKYLEPALHPHHVGFYHSAVLNMHTVDGGEELWELAMRCHTSFSNAISNRKHLTDMGELNFLMCKAIENPHLTPQSSMRTALISVFEDPLTFESSESQQQLGVEDIIGCASSHGIGPSIAVFDVIRDGRLDCAFVYPSPLHSRKQIQDLVEHMKKILVEASLVVEGELVA